MQVFQATCHGLGRGFPPLRSLDWPAGPSGADQLVRRAAATCCAFSPRESWLLTLTGVGGVGKTRLALQAAVDALPASPVGRGSPSWRARRSRGGRVGGRDAPGAPGVPGRADIDVLREHLGWTRSILVLDNREHVLDAAADLVAAALDRCPAWSCWRRVGPLDLEGEQAVPVRPSIPPPTRSARRRARARRRPRVCPPTARSPRRSRCSASASTAVPVSLELGGGVCRARRPRRRPRRSAPRRLVPAAVVARGPRVDRHQTLPGDAPAVARSR